MTDGSTNLPHWQQPQLQACVPSCVQAASPPLSSPDVKGSATHIEHQHRVAVGAAVDAVGQRRRHRLLQQLHRGDARLLRRRVRRALLRLLEVGGHGDHLRPRGGKRGEV